MLFAVTLVISAGRVNVVPHMVAVEQVGEVHTAAATSNHAQPADAQIAYVLARFIEDIRSMSTDPVVVRARWLRAYDMTTDRGAQALNAHARIGSPFAQIGTRPVIATVTSVIRASDDSFEIHWKELSFRNGAPARMERFTAIVTFVLETPDSEKALGKNPLGIYVHAFDWPRDVARVQ